MLIEAHHDTHEAAIHDAPRRMRAIKTRLRRALIKLRATMSASTEAGIGKGAWLAYETIAASAPARARTGRRR